MSIGYSNKLSNLSSQTVRPLVQRLDTLGTGLGTTNAIGNYLTPTRFKLNPQAGELIVVHELHIYIEDGGTLDSGFYGNGLTLVNGIRVEVIQNGVVSGLTNNNVMTNAHWTRVTFNSQVLTFGIGNAALAFKWDIGATMVPLALSAGDELAVILNDNFTGLINHSFSMRGYKFVF